METLSPPHQATEMPATLYYQLVHTLTSLLPPPLDDSPQALCARNHAAIAKVAALLPVDAHELDLAAQCIAARAQAEEMLRLLRQHQGDIVLVMRLNAQYASMIRTSLSIHGRLMRVQALRQKRAAIEPAGSPGSRAHQITERSMLDVVDPAANLHQAASPEATPEAPAAGNQHNAEIVSEIDQNSHSAAFETSARAHAADLGSGRTRENALFERIREARDAARFAKSRLPARQRQPKATKVP